MSLQENRDRSPHCPQSEGAGYTASHRRCPQLPRETGTCRRGGWSMSPFLTHHPLQQDRPRSLRGSHHSPWPPGSPSPSTAFITDFQPASGPSGPQPHPHLMLWGTVPPRDLRASCLPGSVQTRVRTMSWERPACTIGARLAAGFGECPHCPLTANSGSLFLLCSNTVWC